MSAYVEIKSVILFKGRVFKDLISFKWGDLGGVEGNIDVFITQVRL